MSREAFIPIVNQATNENTCQQKTSADASAVIFLGCENFLIVAHTYPVYIRLVSSTGSVTAANGFYLTVGVPLELQSSNKADYLAVINVTGGEHGVVSVMPGHDY